MSNTVSPAEVAAFFGLHVPWTTARSGIVENREIMAITREEMLDIVRRAPQVSAVGWDNAVNEILSYVDENLSPDQVVEEPPAHWPRGGERGGREGGDLSLIGERGGGGEGLVEEIVAEKKQDEDMQAEGEKEEEEEEVNEEEEDKEEEENEEKGEGEAEEEEEEEEVEEEKMLMKHWDGYMEGDRWDPALKCWVP